MRSGNFRLPCVQPPTSSYILQLPHGHHGGHGGHSGHCDHGGNGGHGRDGTGI